MALLRDSVIALLAAMGLATVLFLALRALLGKGEELCSQVYLVLPVDETIKDLEQATIQLQQFRRRYEGVARVVLLDCGMDAQQRRMTEILLREDPLLLLWQEQTLLTQMKERG